MIGLQRRLIEFDFLLLLFPNAQNSLKIINQIDFVYVCITGKYLLILLFDHLLNLSLLPPDEAILQPLPLHREIDFVWVIYGL